MLCFLKFIYSHIHSKHSALHRNCFSDASHVTVFFGSFTNHLPHSKCKNPSGICTVTIFFLKWRYFFSVTVFLLWRQFANREAWQILSDHKIARTDPHLMHELLGIGRAMWVLIWLRGDGIFKSFHKWDEKLDGIVGSSKYCRQNIFECNFVSWILTAFSGRWCPACMLV